MADDAIHPFPRRLRVVESSQQEKLIAARRKVRAALGALAELEGSRLAARYARIQASLLDHDGGSAA